MAIAQGDKEEQRPVARHQRNVALSAERCECANNAVTATPKLRFLRTQAVWQSDALMFSSPQAQRHVNCSTPVWLAQRACRALLVLLLLRGDVCQDLAEALVLRLPICRLAFLAAVVHVLAADLR